MAQDPFGDIPLFREIQRILASSTGPVNLEIAAQIATALARGDGDPLPSQETARRFAEAVHDASGVVSGYTRLAPEEPFATRIATRTEWATETLSAWGWLLDRIAARFTGEMGRMAGEGAEDAGSSPFGTGMSAVAPLLLGIQAGTVVGHLSREVLSRYDLPIPREDDGKLFLLHGNLAAVGSSYGFDEAMFVRWIALREVCRALIAARVPWADSYLRTLLTDTVDAIELDVANLEANFLQLQERGLDALESGIDPHAALPILPTERHQGALRRLHAFLALFHGYADHVAGAVDDSLLGDTTVIDEGMTRYQMSPTEGKAMLGSVLGLNLDRSLAAAGKTFCAAVVQLHGIPALAQVWDAPDNLPTIEEIRDPFAWIERVLTES